LDLELLERRHLEPAEEDGRARGKHHGMDQEGWWVEDQGWIRRSGEWRIWGHIVHGRWLKIDGVSTDYGGDRKYESKKIGAHLLGNRIKHG
jgi:hypothetical protein